MKEIIENITKIADREYRYYGIRFHRGNLPAIGESVSRSYEWNDGECTDIQLEGTSCIDLEINTDKALELIGQYSYGDGGIIIIAGNYASYGDDAHELIIKDAIRIY